MSDRFLVATVGGTPDPIVTSVLHWQPLRVFFVVSPQSRTDVDGKICPLLLAKGYGFDRGRYELVDISDAENFSQTVDELRHLGRRIKEIDQPTVEVVADFTGGTKAMSAALALTAARWPWRTSYVGGGERDKGGLGVVLSGSERVVHDANPWDALGVVAVDDALKLVKTHAFAAAKALLEATKIRVSNPARKRELNALEELVSALADWDRFQHKDALNKLKNIAKYANDIEGALDGPTARRILQNVETLQSHCQRAADGVGQGGEPRVSRELILDLLANARRRLDEQRYDDATARLYRAIEAIAQLRLEKRGYPDTGAVPVDSLPESLRADVQATACDGLVKLGLQESWRLLAELGDDAAANFMQRFGDPKKSVLTARNRSILAHGFNPIKKQSAEQLFDAALELLGTTKENLPRFDWSPR